MYYSFVLKSQEIKNAYTQMCLALHRACLEGNIQLFTVNVSEEDVWEFWGKSEILPHLFILYLKLLNQLHILL